MLGTSEWVAVVGDSCALISHTRHFSIRGSTSRMLSDSQQTNVPPPLAAVLR
jgi:hypothetical protein